MNTDTSQSPDRGRPTLRDVALHAGVSFKTVSRVVNGEKDVSPRMRAVVEESIKQLGFQPNILAAGLRRGKAETIGMVVSNLADPMQARLTAAVEKVAASLSHALLVASTGDDGSRSEGAFHILGRRPLDGLIVLSRALHKSPVGEKVLTGIPTVFVQQPAMGSAIDTIFSDDRLAAATAVGVLVAQGHRRIAFMDDFSDTISGLERLEGFRFAMAALGILDPDLVQAQAQGFREFAAELHDFPDAPTAVILGSTSSSMLFLLAVRRNHGFAVASLASVDAFGVAHLPAVDCSVDYERVAELSVKALLERIRNPQAAAQVIKVPPRFASRAPGHNPKTLGGA